MLNKMYPCLWFPDKKTEAVHFYLNTFRNSELLGESPLASTFTIMGTKCMILEGGPKYQVNPAVSYFIYTGDFGEAERIYNILKEDGKKLMPLQAYDWSPKYAWIEDKYGVNWQIDGEEIRSQQKLVPCFLFANEKKLLVREAVQHYTGIFDNSRILLESPFTSHAEMPDGTLLFSQFIIEGFIINAMSSLLTHDFAFGPGNSIVIPCDTQEEIDYYWEKLGDGGHYDMCGWLTDKFGLSWQIIPAELPALMADDKKRDRVVEAFLQMQKFDLQSLRNI